MAALPLQSVWLDCIVRRLMADDGSRGKVWIIADELSVLRRQAELETLVVRGRKRGLAFGRVRWHLSSSLRPCGRSAARVGRNEQPLLPLTSE